MSWRRTRLPGSGTSGSTWAGGDQQASERGEPWRKPGKEDRILTGTVKGLEDINIAAEEVVIITGTGRSQESINMVTAGAVVIIIQET